MKISTSFCGLLLLIASTTQSLTIAQYNIDKNGAGHDGSNETGIAAQVQLIKKEIPGVDLLVLVEVNRNCSNSGNMNGDEVFADELQLKDSFFAAEYEEGSPGCTTGTEVVSRYPIMRAQVIPFKHQCCGFGRRGLRNMIVAPVVLDNERLIYVIATHLESGSSDFSGVVDGWRARGEQGLEVANYIRDNIDLKKNCVFVVGDFNAPSLGLLGIDSAVSAMREIGLRSAHDIFNKSRTTAPDSSIAKWLAYIGLDFQIDYIFYGGEGCFLKSADIIRDEKSEGISDHVPIVATFNLN